MLIVIAGHFRIQALVQIPVVFVVQGHPVIFRMPLHKDLEEYVQYAVYELAELLCVSDNALCVG